MNKQKFKFLGSFNKYSFILACLIIAIGIFTINSCLSSSAAQKFQTTFVKRGDLQVTVSATGTVEPEEVIDVGAQVVGRIIEFGKDIEGKTIDYGSIVEADAVLAKIDDSLYAAEVSSAEAELKRAQADLLQSQAKLEQADLDWKRAQVLGPSDSLSQTNFSAYKAGFGVAEANVAVAEASIIKAQAALTRANRNLSFCTIKSPVRGVIIDRRVNIGQTVVSNLNSPSLFLLAKDLTRMQVWLAVNEADIGRIQPKQKVKFSVDAFPDDVFEGEVRKIRLNAAMSQNIVTYVVEVQTENKSGKLLPYLTANAQFEIVKHSDILLAPIAALRWFPKREQVAKDFLNVWDDLNNRRQSNSQNNSMGTLWLKKGIYLTPMPVKVIETDSGIAEIQAPDLKEGLEIVISELEENSDVSKNVNPFAPQILKKR